MTWMSFFKTSRGNKMKEIKTQNSTGIRPQNMTELFKLAEMVSSSSMAPKSYIGRPQDTAVAMMMGMELGLNPMQSIQNIAIINGKPSIWGDAMLALVQNHPAFLSIDESFDEPTMTATCTVCRKGGKPHTQKFSQADAEAAGLWGRNTWKQYPKRMLAMRARGFALRNQFADALLGLISAEEAQDMPVEKDITPVKKESIEYYNKIDFDNNFEKWRGFIEAGKITTQNLISKIETKAPLTDEQKTKINELAEVSQ